MPFWRQTEAAEGGQQVGPSQPDHACESLSCVSQAGFVFGPKSIPTAMLECNASAALHGLEAYVDLGDFIRSEARLTPLEPKTFARSQDQNVADHEGLLPSSGIHFEQTASGPGLEFHRAGTILAEQVPDFGLPPRANFFGEDRECRDGIESHHGRDGHAVCRAQLGFPFRPRSACALKAPS